MRLRSVGQVVPVLLIGGALGLVAFAPSSSSAPVAGAAGSFDLTSLALGDGKVTTTGPKRGYVYSCQGSFNGGGAFADGPWIHGSSWNYDEKATVSGAVDWPSASFTAKVAHKIRKLSGNGLPSHTTGVFPIDSSDDAYAYDHNPNSISAHTISERLKAHPKRAKSSRCLSGGAIGVIKTGALLFDALDAGGNDAVAHEVQDDCGGHPQQQGQYHYHALPSCVSTGGTGKHSKLIGWALDGFPIFGPLGRKGVYMTNSKLDACHGETGWVRIGGKRVKTYHYHATLQYPYTLGCYRGTPKASSLPGGGPPDPDALPPYYTRIAAR